MQLLLTPRKKSVENIRDHLLKCDIPDIHKSGLREVHLYECCYLCQTLRIHQKQVLYVKN